MLQQLSKFDEWGMEKDGIYYILPQVWKKLDLPNVPTKVVRYKGKPTRMYVLSEQPATEQPAPEATEQPAEQLEQTTELTPTISYHEFKQDQTAQQKVQDFIARISEVPGLGYLAETEQRKQYFLYLFLKNPKCTFEKIFDVYKKAMKKVYNTEENVLEEIWLDIVSALEREGR